MEYYSATEGMNSWYTSQLEKEMATHSSILAWEIPWTEEPGGLQSIGLRSVGPDWSDSAHTRKVKFGDRNHMDSCVETELVVGDKRLREGLESGQRKLTGSDR